MKTVIGMYDRIEDAQQVIKALQDEGFSRDDISLITRDEQGQYKATTGEPEMEKDVTDGAAVGAGTGAVLGGLGGLLVGLGALAIPGIGPVVAAGPLVATLAGAGLGAAAGGLIGALVDLGVPEEQANLYAEGVRRGATLVALSTDDTHADHAVSIMNRFNPVNLKERGEMWGSADTGFHSREETGTRFQDRQMTDTGYGEREMMEDEERIPVTGPNDVTYPLTGEDVMTGDRMRMDEDFYRMEPSYRQHYTVSYVNMGRDYTFYQPAYMYGYELARDPRYSGYDWDRVEPEARRDWERRGLAGAWDDIKDAVRHAWQSVTR